MGAVRHLALKQGMLGIRVAIMLPYDPTLKNGGTDYRQPDVITIHEPPVYKQTKKAMPVSEAPQDPGPEQPVDSGMHRMHEMTWLRFHLCMSKCESLKLK